ncbi:hypothetical protein ES703_13572 [subsurface metagenome]
MDRGIMRTNHLTLGYLAGWTQERFEKFQNASIVGEINARQFIDHVVKLTAKSPLHGKASLYEIVQKFRRVGEK